MKRTWQNNADEFRGLDAGQGWAFAHLVACSVEKGAGQGSAGANLSVNTEKKVSAAAFAERAGCSDERVTRFLAAWDRECIAAGQPKSKDLRPSDAWTLDLSGFPTWDKGKSGSLGAPRKVTQRVSDVRRALQDPEVVKAVMKDPVASEVVQETALKAMRQENVRHQKEQEARGWTPPKPVDRQVVSHRELMMFMIQSELIAQRASENGFEDEQTRDIALALSGRIIADMELVAEAAKGGTRITDEELEQLLEGGMR